jgi:hypothetical protein
MDRVRAARRLRSHDAWWVTDELIAGGARNMSIVFSLDGLRMGYEPLNGDRRERGGRKGSLSFDGDQLRWRLKPGGLSGTIRREDVHSIMHDSHQSLHVETPRARVHAVFRSPHDMQTVYRSLLAAWPGDSSASTQSRLEPAETSQETSASTDSRSEDIDPGSGVPAPNPALRDNIANLIGEENVKLIFGDPPAETELAERSKVAVEAARETLLTPGRKFKDLMPLLVDHPVVGATDRLSRGAAVGEAIEEMTKETYEVLESVTHAMCSFVGNRFPEVDRSLVADSGGVFLNFMIRGWTIGEVYFEFCGRTLSPVREADIPELAHELAGAELTVMPPEFSDLAWYAVENQAWSIPELVVNDASQPTPYERLALTLARDSLRIGLALAARQADDTYAPRSSPAKYS